MNELKEKILEYTNDFSTASHLEMQKLIRSFVDGLNGGSIRAAEPDGNGGWIVNPWVKQGILL